MRLRIRYSKGILNVGKDLSVDSTLIELKKEIEKLSNIPVQHQCLKNGYPLVQISQSNDALIKDCGINNGDQIILEECANPITLNQDNDNVPVPTLGETTTNPTTTVQSENPIPTTTGPPMAKPGPLPSMTTTPSSSKDGVSPAVLPPTSSSTSSSYGLVANGKGVQVEDGILLVKEIPDDNSCLFQSIKYVMQRSEIDVPQLRNIIADTILNDPVEYNDAILGRPRDDYINFIKKPLSWGGYIELQIFSKYFETEICSLDVKTNRLDRFGEGEYKYSVFIIYSGIHYDAIALTPFEDAPREYERTLFEKDEINSLIPAIKRLGESLKEKHLYTDTSSFDLRCGTCGKGLKGEKEAVNHAKLTGHVDFKEYN